MIANSLALGSDRPFELCLSGDRVGRLACLEPADRDDRRVRGIDLPGDDGLDRGHDQCANDDGIDRFVRAGSVTSPASDSDREVVGRGTSRPGGHH